MRFELTRAKPNSCVYIFIFHLAARCFLATTPAPARRGIGRKQSPRPQAWGKSASFRCGYGSCFRWRWSNSRTLRQFHRGGVLIQSSGGLRSAIIDVLCQVQSNSISRDLEPQIVYPEIPNRCYIPGLSYLVAHWLWRISDMQYHAIPCIAMLPMRCTM